MNWICNLIENTTFLTVISGVLVFIFGQIFLEFALKPIRKYKELKADSAFCLRHYRALFINCKADKDAQNAAYELAAKFIAYAQEKPFWYITVRKKNLIKCCEKFTMLHHCVSGLNEPRTAFDCEREIVKTLKLYWTK